MGSNICSDLDDLGERRRDAGWGMGEGLATDWLLYT